MAEWGHVGEKVQRLRAIEKGVGGNQEPGWKCMAHTRKDPAVGLTVFDLPAYLEAPACQTFDSDSLKHCLCVS